MLVFALPEGFSLSHHSPPVSSDPKPWYIVTFHTSGQRGRFYDQEAPLFLNCIREQGYDDRCVILDAGELRQWRETTLLKSRVCLWALETLPGNILWLDIDARVRAQLPLFDNVSEDIGIRHWPKSSPMSGTFFMNRSSEKCLALVKDWGELCGQTLEKLGPCANLRADQDILGFAMKRHPGFSTLLLPPEYVYIFDLDKRRNANVAPIIEHMQASRWRKIWNPRRKPTLRP